MYIGRQVSIIHIILEAVFVPEMYIRARRQNSHELFSASKSATCKLLHLLLCGINDSHWSRKAGYVLFDLPKKKCFSVNVARCYTIYASMY